MGGSVLTQEGGCQQAHFGCLTSAQLSHQVTWTLALPYLYCDRRKVKGGISKRLHSYRQERGTLP